MTGPRRRIQIALVGFDYDRIIKPIKDHPPNKVYLVYDNKKDDYGKLSKKFAVQLKKNVGEVINCELMGFDPWNFKDCFEKIVGIFQKERNADITINISSSTNLAVAAAVYAASIFKAQIVYVRGEYKELPKLKQKVSAARDPPQFIDPFTPTELSSDELGILRAVHINGGKVESLTRLTKILRSPSKRMDESDMRKNRALLSYKVRKLESLGFVRREPSNNRNKVGVVLTDAGEVLGKLESMKK
jgi:hypothetical protein